MIEEVKPSGRMIYAMWKMDANYHITEYAGRPVYWKLPLSRWHRILAWWYGRAVKGVPF